MNGESKADLLDRMDDQERADYGNFRDAVELYRNAITGLLSEADREIRRLRQANAALRPALERLVAYARDHQHEGPRDDQGWRSMKLREDIEVAERALAGSQEER